MDKAFNYSSDPSFLTACLARTGVDETVLVDWKQQLDRDIETIKSQSNIGSIRSVLNRNGLDYVQQQKFLIHALPSRTTGSTTENKKAISKPSKVQAILKGIKQSPKKVNLAAALVRGMRVEDHCCSNK
ncbi:hypothetical protein CASFOL_034579 [Castilleja foliolosa]|uniref:Uncharacterized protein n=1 Tax=Castilleja foliolosa TaxID=1961234 RepID=A0ABD3BSH1_9LAMI